MRMKTKTHIFYSSYLIGGLIVLGIGIEFLPQGIALSLVLSWFFLFGISQFWILRCKNCGRLAFKTPSGAYVPWVGDACRYCHKEY
jgi:hypothetical protein